jgi:ABC-type multidrug transport system fused ATPase/permease subunit
LLLVEMLALVMSVSTLVGVAAVVPFFAVIGDQGLSARSPWLAWLQAHFGHAGRTGFLVTLGLVLLGMTLLASLINLVGSLIINRFAYSIGNHFCSALFAEYLHRDHLFHLRSSSARLFNNVIWEVSRGTSGLLQSQLMLTNNLATSLLLLGCIVLIHPLLGITSITVLGTSYGLVYLLTRQRLLRNGQLESLHTEERTRIAGEAFGAIRELIVLDARGLFQRRFEDSCTAITHAVVNNSAIAQSPRHVLDFLVAAALVVGALLTLQGGRDAGDWLARLSFLALAAYRLLPALQQIFHGLVRIRADSVAFTQIAPDLERACHGPPRPTRSAHAAEWQGRPYRAIEVKGVSFRYSAERPPALHDVQLTIPAGATVGLVGPSGSGKTTLAELLLGLLLPDEGVIEIDGVPLTRDNRGDWQSTVAYVPQQAFLFDTSLAQNIALAARYEDIDCARLERALQLAQLTDLVRTLPHGDREIIGERGVRLSGGQRQRVGIARALYRRASLLVLDEPTSALDGVTEREVMSAVAALAGSCTVVLIAHLASTVRGCDLLYEIEHGTVRASGSLAELLGRSERVRLLLPGAAPLGVPAGTE